MTTNELARPTAAPAHAPAVGTVEAIHTAPAPGVPMVRRDRVLAIAGVGLEGDRYATRAGTWSANLGVDRDITLVEAEVIADLAASDGIVLAPGQTRRNV